MHLDKNALPFSLVGRTALVTGGGSGIGECICKELAAAGATIWVTDVSEAQACRVAEGLSGAHARHMDVTSERSIQAVSAEVKELDILVNNAGIGLVGTIAQTDPDDFDRILRVNVNSVFYVTRAFLPQLLRNAGRVVNIASVAGLVGIRDRFAYCASKGAVVAMTRQLAADYSKELRVNCICPGTVDSPFVAGFLARYHAGNEGEVREQLKARQPLGRLADPHEVASMVRYICSEEADFLQGAVLPLDGGWTAL